MPKLPVIKPRDLIAILKKKGFVQTRSVGSHFRFRHPDGSQTTVAFHREPIPKGTLKSILRQADLTVEQFIKLL